VEIHQHLFEKSCKRKKNNKFQTARNPLVLQRQWRQTLKTFRSLKTPILTKLGRFVNYAHVPAKCSVQFTESASSESFKLLEKTMKNLRKHRWQYRCEKAAVLYQEHRMIQVVSGTSGLPVTLLKMWTSPLPVVSWPKYHSRWLGTCGTAAAWRFWTVLRHLLRHDRKCSAATSLFAQDVWQLLEMTQTTDI